MNIKDYYFIPLSSWNFNSILSTESISPHFFYAVRLFGTSRNTLTTDGEIYRQYENCLVLYPKVFAFTPNKGEPIFVAIKRDSIKRDNYIIVENELTYCLKTIYLRRRSFFICLPTEDIRKLLLANASPSIEVKTLKKYTSLKNKSNFLIIQDIPILQKQFSSPEIFFPNNEILAKKSQSQPFYDKAFNHIKGFIYGLLGGTVGGKDDFQIDLEKGFQNLQNEITAIKGRVELEERFSDDNFDPFIKKLETTKTLQKKLYPLIDNSQYDTIILYVKELIEFLKKRNAELLKQNTSSYDFNSKSSREVSFLDSQIIELENEILKIQNSIDELIRLRKSLGRSVQYKNNKEELKQEEKRQKELKGMKKLELSKYSKRRNYFRYQKYHLTKTGKTDYDGFIEDIYYKITSTLTDIMFIVNNEFVSKKKKYKGVNLNNYIFDLMKLTSFWYKRLGLQNENYIIKIDESSFDSVILYMAIINTLFENCKCSSDIPESQITELIYSVLKRIRHEPSLSIEVIELEKLLEYRATKSFEFQILNTNYTLQNFIAFTFKPTSIEELQNYLFLKNISHQYIAYSFWGTFNGFANMPKTFTDTIFESTKNENLLDEIDNYLFDQYLNS